MNTFKLVRDEDETGISGTGEVAEGAVFSDGSAVMRWLTDTTSTAFYNSVDDLLKIHGHDGKTRVVYDPDSYPPPWQEVDWETGPRGIALCEALGLDPKIVLGHPLHVLTGLETAHINYTGAVKVPREQWEKALAILNPEPDPVG